MNDATNAVQKQQKVNTIYNTDLRYMRCDPNNK